MCTKRNKLGNTREKGVSDEIRISSLVLENWVDPSMGNDTSYGDGLILA